jgi:triphosphoribosyl-dephospho-CoA synthase
MAEAADVLIEPICSGRAQVWAERVGAQATAALFREVLLAPKPGLVSPQDSGSHSDMDYKTFVRSLHAIKPYFSAITLLGWEQPAFAALSTLGRQAERDMLAATGGVNTHRGAIFNLGLLCAAAGALARRGARLTAQGLCKEVACRWGPAIVAGASKAPPSHGQVVAHRYGAGGARQEAAGGFAAALGVGLPALRQIRAQGGSAELAALQCLMTLISTLADTNLLWRGGVQGLVFAQTAAADYLSQGGVLADTGLVRAQQMHAQFVQRRLSPGGSADLLGVCLFLDGF